MWLRKKSGSCWLSMKKMLILTENSIFKYISQFILSEKCLILTMWTSRLLMLSGADVAVLRTFEAKIQLLPQMSYFNNNGYKKQWSALASWIHFPFLRNPCVERHSIYKSCLFDTKSLHHSLCIKRLRPIWQLLVYKGYWIMNQMQKVFSGLVDLSSILHIIQICLWYDNIPEKSWNIQ